MVRSASVYPERSRKGFTLVELLISIAILAILAVIGMAVYTNISKNARDAKRKGDIDAIAKAYESKYPTNSIYPVLQDTDFVASKIPIPPLNGETYSGLLTAPASSFQVCAALEAHPLRSCNVPRDTCYCVQSSLEQSLATGGGGSGGGGGAGPVSCDPYGTLGYGLVGYWNMDDPSWTGVPNEIKDSSGYGNNGQAINGASNTAVKFASAGSFDGVDDYVNAGNNTSLDVTDKLSISVWVNYGETSTVPRWPSILYKGNSYNYALALNGTISNHPVGLYARLDGFDTGLVYPSTSLPANVWVNLIYTWDGTTGEAKAYFNGVPDGTATGKNGTLTTNTSILAIGANSSGSSNSLFKGLIDDLRIYNRVLSPSEIGSLYNGGAGCLP